MNNVISECPICRDTLIVTKLHCRKCSTSIEGNFRLGHFHNLTADQLKFAATFIRCEGKINRVEDELNISYPTVRARLHDLIRALGYEVKEEEKPAPSIDRQAILTELANGSISATDAAKKLAGESNG